MSDGAFLEKARELAELERLWDDRMEDDPDPEAILRLAKILRNNCWPEILAVLEWARKVSLHHPYSTIPAMQEALEALDAKAEGL